MAEQFEFELVFELPDGDHDVYALSDAVFAAGFDDAIVGTGIARLLGVALEAEGDNAEAAILGTARAIIRGLPRGTRLREVRPDLVSLADVADKLNIKRQALQKRGDMPPPGPGGLYRIDEIANVIINATEPVKGKRKPRFDAGPAMKWLLAGKAARKLNARLTMGTLDPISIQAAGQHEMVRLVG
jgi:hypothetical protein